MCFLPKLPYGPPVLHIEGRTGGFFGRDIPVADHFGFGVLTNESIHQLTEGDPLVLGEVGCRVSLSIPSANEAHPKADLVDPGAVVAGGALRPQPNHSTITLDDVVVPTSEGPEFPMLPFE
jgi:hypothetical protein